MHSLKFYLRAYHLVNNFTKQMFHRANSLIIKPIWPDLFSRSPGPEGSEAQMPKIKVNINWLEWNLAWVIMAIKAFLMQNLNMVALRVLETWRHKISLGRSEQVIKFGYLTLENGFNFLKKWVFMSRTVLLDPKFTPPPMSNSAIFK